MQLKVKGRDIYIPPLTLKPRSAAVYYARQCMTLGGAAQVAAAHCPNERTLDPAVCNQTDPTMPQQAALGSMSVILMKYNLPLTIHRPKLISKLGV